MNLERESVIEKLEEAKDYGLKYSDLARQINLQPNTIYMFKNGTYNLSKGKQLEAVCIIEKYLKEIKEKYRKVEQRGVSIK